MEGIQAKHRKHMEGDSVSSMSSEMSNEDTEEDDDEDDVDFLGNRPYRKPASKANASLLNSSGKRVAKQTPGRKPRRTVKALTESGLIDNGNNGNIIKFRVFDENDFTSYGEMDDMDKCQNLLVSSSLKGRLNNADSDSDNDLTSLNLTRFNNTTNLFRRLTNIDDTVNTNNNNNNNNVNVNVNISKASEQSGDKLTFEQYVKKLTGLQLRILLLSS
jgi:hypothetical protein